MFRREDVLEAVGVPRQECVRLFRDVSRMIVQYDSDGAFRRILRIQVGQQANEFDAVTIRSCFIEKLRPQPVGKRYSSLSHYPLEG